MVRSRRLELPRPFGHSDLNAARLPVPPRPHVHGLSGGIETAPGRRASSKALRAAQRCSASPKSGQVLNGLFTIAQVPRYTGTMLLLAAASIVMAYSGPPAHAQHDGHSGNQRPASLIAEATATVRIVSGVRITATAQPADAQVQTVQLPGADGQPRELRLVEFQ